jgi:hypothetical protein
MSKKLCLTLATVAVMSVLGCTSPDKRITAQLPACAATGNDKDCSVKVAVTQSATDCTVKVDPRQYEIAFPAGQRDKFIYWELAAPTGYTFTDDGIAIEKNLPREFDQPKLMDHGLTFRWKNLHKLVSQKTYEYVVNVSNQDGSISCSLDPKINNQ